MARVTVSYPSGEKKSYASADAARADMAKQGYKTYNDKVSGTGAGTSVQNSGGSSGGSNSSSRSTLDYSGFSLRGLTSTDPANVARNQAAAARYAIQDYQSQGTPIPTNLRDEVNQIIADRSMPGVGVRPTGGTGSLGLPDPMSGRVTSVFGISMGRPAESRSGTGTLGLPDPMAGAITRIAGINVGGRESRPAPSPGPNEFPGLGAPGTPREDNSGRTGLLGPDGVGGLLSSAAPTLPVVTPPATVSVDSGNQEDGAEVSRRNAARSQVPTYEAGGYVGDGGMPIRPSTGSLDLPPALARMLNMPMQSYAEGGMVGPGGIPQRPMTSPMAMNLAQQGGAPVVGMAPPGGQGRPLNFAAIDQQAQQFLQQNPQQVAQIKAEVQKSIAEGEIDEQGLNMFVQVATAALQNPEMWPQLRQVLIRQGILDAEDVGEEYDQGFLIILYIIGKTMTGGAATTPAPQQAAPMSAGQAPEMSMSKGGPLPAKSKNPDGSIPINAHEGEYVIPADVTRKLGTDHFDKMIAKARGMDGKGEQ